MVELIAAFVAALTEGGLSACAAMPAVTSPRLRQAAVAVRVAELEAAPGGFGSYLGMQGTQPLYGQRVKADVLCDVLSPAALGAAGCRLALDEAAEVLSAGVEGVSITALTSFAPEYDRTEDCFRGKLIARCRLWLCAAEADTEAGEVEHFILRGALA